MAVSGKRLLPKNEPGRGWKKRFGDRPAIHPNGPPPPMVDINKKTGLDIRTDFVYNMYIIHIKYVINTHE